MKIEKKSANCYRVRKTINKKIITMYFDHKPTDVELAVALAEKANVIDTKSVNQSFDVCANEYLAVKSVVLSPSTLRGYNTHINQISAGFKAKNINDITQLDIDMEINSLAKKLSPKTVANVHGFISAVFKTFRPSMLISTTLPQKIEYEGYTPTENDIKNVLSNVNEKYSLAFQLGVLGMRRSEICCITKTDISGNMLSITKAKVQDKNNKWIIKNLTKTEEGRRKIYIPDDLVKDITERGFVFDGSPAMLNKHLHTIQDKLKIERFRFHDLRMFYCSYAHSCGIPDSVIMSSGGWKSDFTMKKHYRKTLKADAVYYQEAIAGDLLGRDKIRDN